MKKVLFLLVPLILFTNSCQKNADSKEEVIIEEELTKEEQLKKLYVESVIPLFKNFDGVEIPTEFKIDTKDNSINAGASFGYVEVSQGLINYMDKGLQTFVLAHEVAHIVTLKQANKFNLIGAIPKGSVTNDYKKSEFLADLIAFHLINLYESETSKILVDKLETLEKLLGLETFTHPSGKKRVKQLNSYLQNCKIKSKEEVFKTMFLEIWQLE